MRTIAVPRDFDAFRRLARRLVAAGVEPGAVDLVDEREATGLFAGEGDLPPAPSDFQTAVPKKFVQQARTAADCRDGDRWQFLYDTLWRITRGRPSGGGLDMDNLTDPAVLRLHQMNRAIARDVHKMHAFVRFRKIDAIEGEGERYVAFHRPSHLIVRRVAGFFRERFGAMRWAIFTPDDSVSWDGHRLCFGRGIDQAAAAELAGEDALEDTWRTYYANIFNPARIKLSAMKAELPVKHWPTLPETRIIPDLLQDAPRRVETMMAATKKANKPTAAEYVPETRELGVLREAAGGCRACELCEPETVTQVVFGSGPADARVVFVGEQPGDQEDRAGLPFVGPAGQLLNELLDEAGVDRRKVYVTNPVKHFRHEMKGKFRLHQKPLARHINACRPWLEAEFEAVGPQITVALGSTAAQAIMGRDFRVTKSRGEWMPCPFGGEFMATIHPSAILRIPDDEAKYQAKGDFISDMKQVAARM